MNTQIKTSALCTASNAFASNEFDNEEELNEAKEKIENQIASILSSDAFNNPDIEGIEEIKYYLKTLQVDFADVVEEKELTTPKIKTISVRNESVSMLAYKYYNSLDAVDGLIELNNIQDPKSITGDMRIFTNA